MTDEVRGGAGAPRKRPSLRGRKTWVRVVRATLAPLLIVLVPLWWVLDTTYRASITTLGRDQGIFQYIAWAVQQGDVDYRDIRDVNGPLTHLIHLVMLALGGADEHRFHMLDLASNAIAFAFVGACLPGLGVVARRAGPTPLERGAWAAAACVVLSGQYALYFYWNQAQRESFCDWFLLPSVALQLATPASSSRSATRRIVWIGALSVIAWFGKPSFAAFSLVQVAVLLFDDEILASRPRRLAAFALGGALGAIPPIAYTLRYGDLVAYLRIAFRDVPRIYRFIWAKSAPEIFGEDGPLTTSTTAIACGLFVLALVVVRVLPRRALVIALLPGAALANVVAQHKGFGYHFHPLTAATWIGALVVVVALWERHRGAPRTRPAGRLLALGTACAVAWQAANGLRLSPHLQNVWILAGGETPERRQMQEYYDRFKTYDFFPWEMRQAAWYLRANTPQDARVQMYGMDPYMLFLAGRRSATPYIYAYDLNADAALDGGWSNHPTDGEAFQIRLARDAHERDMLARLHAAPPAAFVFVDHSPLVSYAAAHEDFEHCCADTARWLASRYHERATFGPYHVWMRNDP